MNELPWIKSYPPDIRWDAEIHTMPVYGLLDAAAAHRPDSYALEFNEKKISYRELQDLVDRAAKGLQQLGVGPGVHVGLYLPNTPHYVIAFFAILKAGGTVVNYSPLDAEQVLAHKIDDSATDIIVTLDWISLYPLMDRLRGHARLRHLVIGNLGEMSASSDTTQATLRAARQLSEVAWGEACSSFEQLIDNDGRYRPVPISDLDETIAVLQYTGGTTGMPKGAMLTHANLGAACSQAMLNTGGADGLQYGEERFLGVLPLFHIYALTFNMLLAIRIAARLILHTRFEVERAIKEITEKKVTVLFGVPTMYTAINGFADIVNFDLSTLKLCSSGGAPLPIEVHERFQQLSGRALKEGWGMTEVCGVGTATPQAAEARVGTCGIPLCGVTIRFLSVDDPASYVAYGERGEVCIAGPNVMKGYWKNPDATAATMTADGFLRTGDVGYMDQDGYLHIVDRIKDMILCSGFNVYPRNIEEAIYKHPSVAEVIVIGIHDEYRGEAPKAFIKLKDDAAAFTLDELKIFLKNALGKHEMLQAMEIRDALPKTAVGKLSKKELYEEEKGALAPSVAAGATQFA